MSLTVSIPTYNTPPRLLVRAITSILDQTYPDVTVVVVNDGGQPVTVPNDPRLFIYDLPVNRGRYFADAVVARAARTPRFTVHDSDDWSNPDRYQLMVRQPAPVVASSEMLHRVNIPDRTVTPRCRRRRQHTLRHLFHMSALYRTSLVDGLLHPGFRIGYDSLLSSLLNSTVPVAVVPDAIYHRAVRNGSLTTSAATGFGTPARLDVVHQLNELWATLAAVPDEDRLTVARQIATTHPCNVEVEQHAARLADRLPVTTLDASDVAVTILTGRRPELLERTIAAAERFLPGLLDTSHLTVLHNGADLPTRNILDRHDTIIDRVDVTDTLHPIGHAISRCAEHATRSGRRFWLHLEDDWEVADAPTGWLDAARNILNRHADVSQVRLRHTSNPVLTRHMVTGQKIRWQHHDGWRASPDAHLTFNPSLLRTADIVHGWPCTSERHAQQLWHTAGQHRTAQLDPGVFTHIGHRSLRLETGSPA